MLVALISLAAAQTTATQHTNILIHRFLDYAATHSVVTVRFHASDMVLNIHSNASYLSESHARSRAGGLPYRPHIPYLHTRAPSQRCHSRCEQYYEKCTRIRTRGGSRVCFLNTQDACIFCTTLRTLRHLQPPTPIQTDNQCASDILNSKVKQKRFNARNMQF